MSSLSGKLIAITASRKADEQAAYFQRYGAEVFIAPTVRIVPVDSDAELLAVTEQIIHNPPEIVLITTGYGLNGWFASAQAHELESALKQALVGAKFYARGAKGRGAIRALGLGDAVLASEETTESLVDRVLEEDIFQQRIVIQQHGNPDIGQVQRLGDAGALVCTITPHRWADPEEPELVNDLVQKILASEVDAITFTSAPAVHAFFGCSQHLGVLSDIEKKLREIVVAVVGPVTAEPLLARGIEVLQPQRARLGALTKALVARLS